MRLIRALRFREGKVFPQVTNYVQHWLFRASFITMILIKIFCNIQTKIHSESVIQICDITYACRPEANL
jgi:hypothetical protein